MISNALSLMIAIPLLGAVISFFAGSKAKFVALLASLVPLYLSLQMYMEFDKTSKIMQFVALHELHDLGELRLDFPCSRDSSPRTRS